jgi:hypothetical protein
MTHLRIITECKVVLVQNYYFISLRLYYTWYIIYNNYVHPVMQINVMLQRIDFNFKPITIIIILLYKYIN